MKSFDFSCTAVHHISTREVLYFSGILQFFSKALIRPALRECSVLLHLLSLALSWCNSRHCSVISRLLSSLGPPFRYLLRHFFSPYSCPLSLSFMFSFRKKILSSKFRSTSPIVDWHDEYKFLTNPTKKRWHFFRSPVKLTSRCPSSSPRLCTDGVRSYADIITKFSRLDGLPFFLTHGASRPKLL